jgi:hypothetical protein
MKKQKIEILDRINECPKCHQLMERRKHKTIGEKQLNKTFYFSEWDYCRPCNHVQFYEEYKVFSKDYDRKFVFQEEIERQNSFFDYI